MIMKAPWGRERGKEGGYREGGGGEREGERERRREMGDGER